LIDSAVEVAVSFPVGLSVKRCIHNYVVRVLRHHQGEVCIGPFYHHVLNLSVRREEISSLLV
jgi:hypothetical protein